MVPQQLLGGNKVQGQGCCLHLFALETSITSGDVQALMINPVSKTKANILTFKSSLVGLNKSFTKPTYTLILDDEGSMLIFDPRN